MTQQKPSSNAYLETKVMTASPEQLQLMLYDGAIKFCEQASEAIKTKNIEESFNLITKAENIIMELNNSMKDEYAPEACANMRRLYLFCYDRLVTANLKKDLKALSEAIEVLRQLRETWLMLIEKLKEERSEEASGQEPELQMSTPSGPREEIGATINFEG